MFWGAALHLIGTEHAERSSFLSGTQTQDWKRRHPQKLVTWSDLAMSGTCPSSMASGTHSPELWNAMPQIRELLRLGCVAAYIVIA